MQNIFICITTESDLRSTVTGWTFESGNNVNIARHESGNKTTYTKFPVGLVRDASSQYPLYPTVLHALGDGWKLLAPPKEDSVMIDDRKVTSFEWWLTISVW